jgi:hypothetical protein
MSLGDVTGGAALPSQAQAKVRTRASRPLAWVVAVLVLVLVGGAPAIAALVGNELELTSGLLFGGLVVDEDLWLADAMPLGMLRTLSIAYGGLCLLAGAGLVWRRRWAWQLGQGLALGALVSCVLQAMMATYEQLWDATTVRDGLLATCWLVLALARWACVPVLLAFLLASPSVASLFPGYVRPARERARVPA